MKNCRGFSLNFLIFFYNMIPIEVVSSPFLSLGFSFLYCILSASFYAFTDSNGLVFTTAIFYVIAEVFTSVVLFGKGDSRTRTMISHSLVWGSTFFALLQIIGLIHHDRELLFWTSFIYFFCILGVTFLMHQELKREKHPTDSHSKSGELSSLNNNLFPTTPALQKD